MEAFAAAEISDEVEVAVRAKAWEGGILPSKLRRAEIVAHQKEKATQNQQKEETRVRKAVAKEDCLNAVILWNNLLWVEWGWVRSPKDWVTVAKLDEQLDSHRWKDSAIPIKAHLSKKDDKQVALIVAIKCSIRIRISDSEGALGQVSGLAASDVLQDPEDEEIGVYDEDME